MKKIIFVFITVFVFSLSLYAAGSKKAQTSNVWQGEQIYPDDKQPFGFSKIPCFMPDADTDFFACTGVYRGHKNQDKEEVKAFALAIALDSCQRKAISVYPSMVSDFLQKYYGNEKKDLLSFDFGVQDKIIKIIRRDRIIDTMDLASVYQDFTESHIYYTVSNLIRIVCVKYSIRDGIVDAYIGIKIIRNELYEEVANAVKNVLAYEEKRQKENRRERKSKVDDEEFIRKIDEKFKNYEDFKGTGETGENK